MKIFYLQTLVVFAFILATVEGLLDFLTFGYYERFNFTGKLCEKISYQINKSV